jgi:hypothetical protein
MQKTTRLAFGAAALLALAAFAATPRPSTGRQSDAGRPDQRSVSAMRCAQC